MQTRREYAVSLGLAKMTRGRLSLEAKNAIAEAEAKGMKFSDSGVKAVVRNDDGTTETVTVAAPENYFGATPDPRYPNDSWYVAGDKKKKVSSRAACGNCNYSLSHHKCGDPVALYVTDMVEVIYGG